MEPPSWPFGEGGLALTMPSSGASPSVYRSIMRRGGAALTSRLSRSTGLLVSPSVPMFKIFPVSA